MGKEICQRSYKKCDYITNETAYVEERSSYSISTDITRGSSNVISNRGYNLSRDGSIAKRILITDSYLLSITHNPHISREASRRAFTFAAPWIHSRSARCANTRYQTEPCRALLDENQPMRCSVSAGSTTPATCGGCRITLWPTVSPVRHSHPPRSVSTTMTRPIEYSRVRQGGMPHRTALFARAPARDVKHVDPRSRNKLPPVLPGGRF